MTEVAKLVRGSYINLFSVSFSLTLVPTKYIHVNDDEWKSEFSFPNILTVYV